MRSGKSNGINGRKIAWTFYDAESQTQKAITETRRLISQDQVQLIVSGGNMSGIALAMAPMMEAAKIPFISSEGALAIVTPVAERHWVFKSTVDDEDVLERIADYLDKKKIKQGGADRRHQRLRSGRGEPDAQGRSAPKS